MIENRDLQLRVCEARKAVEDLRKELLKTRRVVRGWEAPQDAAHYEVIGTFEEQLDLMLAFYTNLGE